MLFRDLHALAPDPLLAVAQQARSDIRPDSIDLSIGIYRNNDGDTVIPRAVKEAEDALWRSEMTKSYLPTEGVPLFRELLDRMVFPASEKGALRSFAFQSLGGTGALSLAARLIGLSGRDATIWLGTPTWTNHLPVFQHAGLRIRTLPQFTFPADGGFPVCDIEAFLCSLERDAKEGDAILLQPVCHNPTGQDWSDEEWEAISDVVARRRLLPVVDMAYHGFGRGLAEDLVRVQALARHVETVLVCYSCSKNFGLYRERVGALLVTGHDERVLHAVSSQLVGIARADYSMPPAHGARAVAIVLSDERLMAEWQREVSVMRGRLTSIRSMLAACGQVGPIDFGRVAHGAGMFCLLPLAPDATQLLRKRDGIYIAGDGRMNIAGLTTANLSRFVDAVARVVSEDVR